MLGAGNDTILAGSTWTDGGITVTDNSGATIEAIVTGEVTTTVPGTYEITHTATDGSGNTTVVTRYVTVLPAAVVLEYQCPAFVSSILVGDSLAASNCYLNEVEMTMDASAVKTTEAGIYRIDYSVEIDGVTYTTYKMVYVYSSGLTYTATTAILPRRREY